MKLTEKEIRSKSKKELEDILIDIYQSPYAGIYFSIKSQLDRLSKEIEEAEISLESKSYDNFMKWTEKSLTAAQNMDGLLGLIDPDILRREREKRLEADDYSPEAFVDR